MSIHSKIIIILSLIVLFIFAGCIRTSEPPQYIKVVSHYTTPEGTFEPPSQCIAFLCKNRSGFISFFKSLFGSKPSLYEGECYFRKFQPWNDDSMMELGKIVSMERPERVKSFMIGQGPNIAAADEAQRFCNGNMGFALHWLMGNLTTDPPTPKLSSVECALKKDIIPFFVYYTNSTRFPSQYLGGREDVPIVKISKAIAGKGPVFISPEAEFEYIKHTFGYEPEDYKNQFVLIRQNCRNCLVSAFVKIGDFDTLDFLNRSSFVEYPSILGNATDFVTFSIKVDDFGCDEYKIVNVIQNFSQQVLQKYGKTSIVVIKMNISDKCTEEKLAKVNEYLYANIPLLLPSGLIGMASNDLALMFGPDGVQDNPLFNSWFQNCRSYYNTSDIYNSPQVPILLPEAGGTLASKCNALNSASMTMLFKCGRNYSEMPNIVPLDPISACGDDACLPDIVISEASGGRQLNPKVGMVLDGYEKYCERWQQQIRDFSARFDYDPSVARAVLWHSNNFNPAEGTFDVQDCSSTECLLYAGDGKEICCGIWELAEYKKRASMELQPVKFYVHSREYMEYYFSIYGYLYGLPAMTSKINEYENRAADAYSRGNFDYYFEPVINSIISSARTLRSICGICGEKENPPAPPLQWLQQPALQLFGPVIEPNCTVKIGSDRGFYLESGIILESKAGINNVTAATAGIIKKIGEEARRFKYVVVESSGLTTTYSNLVSVERSLTEGHSINAGDKIGNMGEYLRFEVCQGSYSQCTNVDLGLDRPFIDSSAAINVVCHQ